MNVKSEIKNQKSEMKNSSTNLDTLTATAPPLRSFLIFDF